MRIEDLSLKKLYSLQNEIEDLISKREDAKNGKEVFVVEHQTSVKYFKYYKDLQKFLEGLLKQDKSQFNYLFIQTEYIDPEYYNRREDVWDE